MRLRSGMEVELVAAEPLVMDPVGFDWGPDGRLWVVEMRDYPNGLTWNQPDDPMNEPGGRIKVLTDTNGDGRYDEAQVFLDGLGYPSAVKVWGKGVLVTVAPQILYAEDTDGDGVADKREVWFEGFARSNQQHRVNGLAWGLDNWLHVANGDGGGVIRSGQTRDEVDIRGNDLRIDPFTGRIELLSGRTQCGRHRDDWGNWFGCNNSNPLWHYPLRFDELLRNPLVSAPRAFVDVPVEPGAAPVYPASETLERFNQPDRANRWTSACGPTIYRDEWLGREFAGNAFICEPVHNLVGRQVLSPNGSTFTSDRSDDERSSEFMASTDPWSRPVSVRTGPDGALWVADMYRLVIEHPEWIPTGWQRKLDIRAGSDRGRIYRVFPKGKRPAPLPRLDALDAGELVAQLESLNGVVRDLAHQMLLWSKADAAEEALRDMLKNGGRATARLHALSVLSGLGKLTDADVVRALHDEHPAVARLALRLAGDRVPSETLVDAAKPRLQDAWLTQELAGVLGNHADAARTRMLAAILLIHRADAYVTATALSSVSATNIDALVSLLTRAYTDVAAFRAELAALGFTAKAPPDSLMKSLASMAAAWEKPVAMERCVAALVASDRLPSWKLALLTGLLESGKSLPDLAPDEGTQTKLSNLLVKVRSLIRDTSLDVQVRVAALRLLACPAVLDPATDVELCANLLTPQESPELQSQAFVVLGRMTHADVGKQLVSRWAGLPPTAQTQAQSLLVRRPLWSAELLDALETNRIPRNQIDVATRQRLLKSGDDTIRSRSEGLFAAASSESREQVLAAHADVLSLKGDPAAGKTVFATACIACHRAEEVGNAIGPDLAALTDRSHESMLTAILDPNRAVEDKFRMWSVTLVDGSEWSGLIGDESAGSVSLRLADGSDRRLPRASIAKMTPLGVSLMPEGLEAVLSREQLADVMAYVGSLGQDAAAGPALSARVRPDSSGVIRLKASHCKFSGDRLEYMPDFDALGWWTSAKDRAAWTVALAQPGRYRVEWEYSVSPEAAGNDWKLLASGRKVLGGAVRSTGAWETFQTQTLGELDLPAADTEIVLKSDGEVTKALLDLREIRLVPVE